MRGPFTSAHTYLRRRIQISLLKESVSLALMVLILSTSGNERDVV